MPINKVRHVRYEGDGIDSYQCLKCYKGFDNYTREWKFCPYCGTQWEVGLVEPSKRLLRLARMYEIIRDRGFNTLVEPDVSRSWVLEVRSVWNDKPAKWEVDSVLHCWWQETSAKDALRELKIARAIEAERNPQPETHRFEYRLRRATVTRSCGGVYNIVKE